MSIYEYDEELHIKTMMDIGREEGYETGVSGGINGVVSIMRNMNISDEDIIANIVNTFDFPLKISPILC